MGEENKSGGKVDPRVAPVYRCTQCFAWFPDEVLCKAHRETAHLVNPAMMHEFVEADKRIRERLHIRPDLEVSAMKETGRDYSGGTFEVETDGTAGLRGPGQFVLMSENATLRDEMAMRAMGGLLSNPAVSESNKERTLEDLAIHCYRIADAMLKAREAQ